MAAEAGAAAAADDGRPGESHRGSATVPVAPVAGQPHGCRDGAAATATATSVAVAHPNRQPRPRRGIGRQLLPGAARAERRTHRPAGNDRSSTRQPRSNAVVGAPKEAGLQAQQWKQQRGEGGGGSHGDGRRRDKLSGARGQAREGGRAP